MEKNAKKPDRRVLRTKKAIRHAFAKLLSQKPVTEITVTELAQAADINRKTFYNYYSDVYQVVDEIENEIVTAFEAALQEIDLKRDLQPPYTMLTKLTAIIDCDRDFYRQLLRSGSNSGLMTKIVSSLKSKSKESLANQVSLDNDTLNLMIDYTVGGIVDVYQNWVTAEHRIPIDRAYRQISIITFEGIKGLLAANSD